MNIEKTTSRLQKMTEIDNIQLTEIPIPMQPALTHLRHLIIVNVGPVSLDLSNPEIALDACVFTFNKITAALCKLKDCKWSRFSISIFVPPGNQSARVFSGYIETEDLHLGTCQKLRIQEASSNLSSIRSLIESRPHCF